jgi:hypothetical protein
LIEDESVVVMVVEEMLVSYWVHRRTVDAQWKML